jgi:hypothetical protein
VLIRLPKPPAGARAAGEEADVEPS